MAHDYGFLWRENLGDGKWAKHMLDDTWSQGHALTMLISMATAVPTSSPGSGTWRITVPIQANANHLGIYWYEYRPAKDGSIEWIQHIIEYGGRVSAGMQIAVADLDGDGDLDLAMGGKTGLFLFENLSKRAVKRGSER